MRTRDYYLKREATLADSDTTILDINVKDPITCFAIQVEATNGATSCVDHELADDISSIEIVDGSNVLWSLNMAMARGLNFFENKRLPFEVCSEGAADVQQATCLINFGRYLNDLNYYFDATRFNNPQLRITHALTISATAGFATGTGKLTVRARLIEEGTTGYKGFLSAKEVISYTSGTSGDREVDLPKNYPYRFMLLKALATTKTHEEVLSKHKLSLDADSVVPFNDYTEDLAERNIEDFGYAQQVKELFTAQAGTALLDIYNIKKAHGRTKTTLNFVSITGIDAEQLTLDVYVVVSGVSITSQATEQIVEVEAQGSEPYSLIAVPFGRPDEPNDWLKANHYGDIKLFSTQAAAGACSVILQQLHE